MYIGCLIAQAYQTQAAAIADMPAQTPTQQCMSAGMLADTLNITTLSAVSGLGFDQH